MVLVVAGVFAKAKGELGNYYGDSFSRQMVTNSKEFNSIKESDRS